MTPFDPEKLGILLTGTARDWRNKLDRRLRPLGLSQGKWTTLAHLADAGAPLTQRQLAELVGIEGPTLAGILDRLQSDGWIERKESASDRRCKMVHLRRNSAVILDQIFSTAQMLRHELLADIPPADLQTCMSVLTRIRQKADLVTVNGIGQTAAPKTNGAKPKRTKRAH
ncbi:MAG: MarR family transcriptional regulator [Spartobacteria bacterium]